MTRSSRFLIRFLMSSVISCGIVETSKNNEQEKTLTKKQNVGQNVACVLTILILCLLTVSVTFLSYEPEGISGGNVIVDTAQYQHQADAILNGHAYLDIETPEWLDEMEDPYDTALRGELSTPEEPYRWDYAYYDGHYYCYFGVLPAITLFVPFKLVTRTDLSNHMATAILGVMCVISSSMLGILTYRRVSRKRTAHGVIFSSIIGFVLSGATYLVFYPSFYHIAILSALFCSTGGTSLWLYADGGGDDTRVRRVPLCIGSLLIGATLLARPVVFLSVLLAFPIFGHRFVRKHNKERQFFGTNSIAVMDTLLVFVPILLMVMATLSWNMARFGNPLDFGYKYNLTGFDMMTKEPSEKRTLLGIMMYFLAPINVQRHFPFVINYATKNGIFAPAITSLQGVIIEPYYGGLVAFCPFVVGTLAVFNRNVKGILKERHSLWLAIVPVVISILIAGFDSTVAITQRYQSDFFWLWTMSSVPSWVAIIEICQSRKTRRLVIILIAVLVMISICLQFWNLLTPDRYCAIVNTNPDLYTDIASRFTWLEALLTR